MHGLLLAKIFDYVEYHGFLNMEDLNALSLEAEQDLIRIHFNTEPVNMRVEETRECEA